MTLSRREELEALIRRCEWLMEFVAHCEDDAIPLERQQALVARFSDAFHALENLPKEPAREKVEEPAAQEPATLVREFFTNYHHDLRLHIWEYSDGTQKARLEKNAKVEVI